MKSVNSRELIKVLEKDGWIMIGAKGSHPSVQTPEQTWTSDNPPPEAGPAMGNGEVSAGAGTIESRGFIMTQYIALIHPTETGSYGISFPDFPGCISAGSSLEETIREGTEALGFHADGMREDGNTIPKPRSLDDLHRNPPEWVDFNNAIIVSVPLLPAPGRAIRVQITLDERLLSRIDAVTKNRSGFLADAAGRVLGAP